MDCPICLCSVNVDDEKFACPRCNLSYHVDCWIELVKNAISEQEVPCCVGCQMEWTQSLLPASFHPQLYVALDRKVGEVSDESRRKIEMARRLGSVRQLIEERHRQTVSKVPAGLRLAMRVTLDHQKKGSERRLRSHIVDECSDRSVTYRHCPKPICGGRIDSRRNRCSQCQAVGCSDCLEIACEDGGNPDSHRCDAAILESVKRIKSDSVQCPQCHIPITRAWGCDVMHCVHCKGYFSYSTGQPIVASHNPEVGGSLSLHSEQDMRPLLKLISDPEHHAVIGHVYDQIDRITSHTSDPIEELKLKREKGELTDAIFLPRLSKLYEQEYLHRLVCVFLTNFLDVFSKVNLVDSKDRGMVIEQYRQVKQRLNGAYGRHIIG